jgi:tripartite-type tricarboxylate transporter receptor subunit TctC
MLEATLMKRILWLLVLALSPYDAGAQNPFYQGKTITVIAGVSAGSVYDLYARLITQHMGKHIPGNPNFVVQNMTGAGSIIGANYLYNVAKPDGLTIGAVQSSIFFNQLQKHQEVKFDWAKFTWIGSSDKSDWLLYMRADLPYKSLADVRRTGASPKCGSTGVGTSESYIPKLLEETIGTKFTIVAGYQGGGDIDLAVERGEIQCRALTVQAFHSREPYHSWRKNNFTRVVMQTGRTRDPRLPETPTLTELMDEHNTPAAARRIVPLVLASGEFGRPIIAPPGVAPEKVKILREAFVKTVNDPELLAEAKKKNLSIIPTPGAELEVAAKNVVTQSPEMLQRLKTLMD